MKVLFSLSKEKKFDKMFIEENLINDLVWILTDYIVNNDQQILKLTSKKISQEGKMIEVHNQQAISEFYLYSAGTVKNISEDKKVLASLQENNALEVFVDLTRHIAEKKD